MSEDPRDEEVEKEEEKKEEETDVEAHGIDDAEGVGSAFLDINFGCASN